VVEWWSGVGKNGFEDECAGGNDAAIHADNVITTYCQQKILFLWKFFLLLREGRFLTGRFRRQKPHPGGMPNISRWLTERGSAEMASPQAMARSRS
jgi:hypothetical protein